MTMGEKALDNSSPLPTFMKAYIKSMRPYYAFITGISGWIGVAFAKFTYPNSYSLTTAIIVLFILFLSWGANQIFNDFLGLQEDRINAPRRPMVTGELHIGYSLSLSVLLIVVGGFISWFLSPIALIPFFLGTILNIAYEYSKGVPFLGNVVFGVMIAMCSAYGYLAMAPDLEIIFTPTRLGALFLVALSNGLMTYYTYFKDVKGDKAAGKITAVVLMGIPKSRILAVLVCFLPSIFLAIFYVNGTLAAVNDPVFLTLASLTLLMQIRTGVNYYLHPTGPKAYFSLSANIQACTATQITIISMFNPILGIVLFIASYVFIRLLFNFHPDEKA